MPFNNVLIRLRPCLLLAGISLLAVCAGTPRVLAADEMAPVVVDGDEINYLQDEGRIVAKGNVKMKYKEVELSCEEADYNANANTAHVTGDVKITRDGTVLYGSDVVFDFNTLNAQIQDVRVEDHPVYGHAQQAEKIGQEKYVLEKGYVTTCDLEKPHYRLTTRRVTIYPGSRVVAKNMVLMVGKVPVFYIPYFSQSLEDKSFSIEVVPGKNSEWGYYLLTRWRYHLSEEQKGKIHIDWYEKRGQGLGLTHKMESKTFGQALVNYYRIEDSLYNLQDRDELFDRYPERRPIPDKRLEDDRYKTQFSYSWDPVQNLSVKSEFHKFSDENFMKDFFQREYQIEPHPLSYTLINYSLDRSSLSLLGQKRANTFFTETEYLPQLEYDFYRQNIGASKFYFASDSKLGNLNYRRANSGLRDTAFRLHSENIFSYIDKLKWLSISPFAGTRSAYYSRNTSDGEEIFRYAPVTGVALSAKLYKNLEAKGTLLGESIEAMRHIVTPVVTYDYTHHPTIPNKDIYQFDTSDDIGRQERVTFALQNKLQARNQERTWDYVYFSPAVEYQIHREGLGSYFNTVKTDLEIYPRKGLSFTSDAVYSLFAERLNEVSGDFKISKTEKVFVGGEEVDREKASLALGHRYAYQENNQGTLDFSYQLTPKTQFHNYIRYEYDTQDLERQQYAFRQDLHCWWMDIGIDLNRHSRGGKDLTFWIAFTLKAFPDISFDFDQTYSGAKPVY